MRSKHKIWILTLLITLGFLIRDTLRIDGPIEMRPTYITLFVSLVLSFFLIILTENRKTHNHTKAVLSSVSLVVATLSIFGAYLLDLQTYQGQEILSVLQLNAQKAVSNIADFGFFILLAAIAFGLIVGSDKSIRRTYSFHSSKQQSSTTPYTKYIKKR